MAKIIKLNNKKQSKVKLKQKTAPSKNTEKPRMSLKFNQKKQTRVDLNRKSSPLSNLSGKQKLLILCAIIAVVIVAIVVTLVLIGSNNGGLGNNGGNNSQIENDDDRVQGGSLPEQILEFHVASPPIKTIYYVGEEINYEGLYFYYRNSADRSEYIYYKDDPSSFTITGFDSSSPVENQVITVESRGFTDTFTVTILEIPKVPPVLDSIYLSSTPQTEYMIGDLFKTNGAKIVCIYSDGTQQIVPLKMSYIYGFGGIDTLGEHEIRICYFDENGGYAETTLIVTMVESIE